MIQYTTLDQAPRGNIHTGTMPSRAKTSELLRANQMCRLLGEIPRISHRESADLHSTSFIICKTSCNTEPQKSRILYALKMTLPDEILLDEKLSKQ